MPPQFQLFVATAKDLAGAPVTVSTTPTLMKAQQDIEAFFRDHHGWQDFEILYQPNRIQGTGGKFWRNEVQVGEIYEYGLGTIPTDDPDDT